MKKILFIILILFSFTLVGCVKNKNIPIKEMRQIPVSEETTLVSCDTPNRICAEGSICYASMICSRGQECGAELGDLLCHKNCETNADCPPNTPTCQEIELWKGDYGERKKLCF